MCRQLFVFLAMLLVAVSCPVSADANDHREQTNTVYTVTYFFSEPRCRTCTTIETLTGEAVTATFENEIASGLLLWRTVNTDLDENRHYIDDFKLFTKSVVITEQKDGEVVRYQVLQKVWELVHDPAAFQTYVAESVRSFMAEKP